MIGFHARSYDTIICVDYPSPTPAIQCACEHIVAADGYKVSEHELSPPCFIGYLSMISQTIYGGWGATNANITVGVIAAIVDNIPVMFAVLSMMPDM